MKIATWNVNSLRVRLPQVLDWLEHARPDVLCLQETKLTDEKFPHADFRTAGYHAVYSGQKTYNGVAIMSRKPLATVCTAFPDFPDEQKRVLAATISGIRVVNVYVPNGQAVGSEKFQYKLEWFKALRRFVAAELRSSPRLIVLGDFNIAPEPRDVHDPQAWEGQVLCSAAERAALRELIAAGLVDVFRNFEQPDKSFSWWDYRAGAFRRNNGLRIDLVLASAALSPACIQCLIDVEPRRNEQPSDHAPVIAEFSET